MDTHRSRYRAPRRRPSVRIVGTRRRAATILAVAAPFAASALGARALARNPPAHLAIDFAQPLVVVTGWGDYGRAAFAWLALGVALATLAFGLVLRGVATRPLPIDRSAIFASATLALLGAFAWPFVFSSDVYAYATYGALAAGGHDPYVLAPPALHDPFLDAARWQWRGPVPVDIYGPAMLVLSRTAVAAAGYDVARTLALLRIAAACAFLASLALFDFALRDARLRTRSLALAAAGLNPVVLWSVAEGHNDAFVALGLASAVALARSRRRVPGGLIAGLLPALKATGLLFSIGYVLEIVRTRRSPRNAIVATALGLALAAAWSLPPLLSALATVRAHGRYAPTVSAAGLIGFWPALGCALAAALWGARRIVAGERAGYAWIGIAASLGLPNDYPWYALWLVPLAIAAGTGPAALALGGATILALVRYLPDASGTLTGVAAKIAAGIAIAPLAFALTEFGHPARRKKDSPSP